ncbi:hypothetical protein PSACC_02576 [Paramicrosporidium saccamoebae]|uniref:DUF1640-domain-containing protein n=1 Tax=Paramicrosporidium saccamoebae TaxID=1246581 RepID=A0A2H9TIQ4_9FUNG|nr:hypothetical protein PSACC_02576 [Paramicrosporidium saccamoebae]
MLSRRIVYKFSTLPFRDELVTLLQTEKFERTEAEKMIDAIDAAVQESESASHIQFDEYQRRVEHERRELLKTETLGNTALNKDYEFLLGEISRTQQRIKEETQHLESSVKLDLNLERKRRADLMAEVDGKAAEVGRYLGQKTEEIQKNLQAVSRQAMTAIGSSAAALLFGFLVYKLSQN